MKKYFIFGMLLFLASGALAQIPRTINYQGLITDSETTEPLNGLCDLTFSLYTLPSAADPDPGPLWSENHSVELDNGLFNVKLGSVSPLDNITFDRPYCLGIKIGDEEILPRQVLSSVAYSLNSADVIDGKVVKSINGLKDDITIEGGENVTIDTSGNTLTVSAAGSGEGLVLPYSDIVTSGAPCFKIVNDGGGSVISGENWGTGQAGDFWIRNEENENSAVSMGTNGNGTALNCGTDGTNYAAALHTLNPQSIMATLGISQSGKAYGIVLWGEGEQSDGIFVSVPPGNTGLQISGGTKNAVVATSQGARALYTEESAEVWFTDYGFGQLDDGSTSIEFDGLFAETVSLDEPYHVFLEEYGDADLYVANRTPSGFDVRARSGDENVEFSFRIVAKRKGYEETRLEHVAIGDMDPNLYPETARKTAEGSEEGNPFAEILKQRSRFDEKIQNSR